MAAQLGYCGLDAQRRPLRGDEIRACWESLHPPGAAPAPPLGAATAWPLEPGEDRTAVRLLEFVEVPRDGRLGPTPGSSRESDEAADAALRTSTAEPRWSLWGEADV